MSRFSAPDVSIVIEKYRVQVEEPVAPVKPVPPKQSGTAGAFNSASGATDDYLSKDRVYNTYALPKYERDMAAHTRFLDFEEALANQYYELDLQSDFDAMPQETKTKLAIAYSATSAISEVAQEAINDVRKWRDNYIANLKRGPMGGIDALL